MCDGADLNSESCVSLGYESGTLGCFANCAFDFGGCVSYFPSLAEIALNFGMPGFPIKDDPTVAGDMFYATDISGVVALPMATQSTTITGGSLPHDNVMPTLTVQYCISTAGIFPQQS
jgi:hypothetical protein